MGRYSGKTCRLILMLVITVIFFVAEIVAGYMGNSVALVSDSFNMLSDILSLCVGLTAARVSRRAGSGRFSFGLGRAEVVGALANAVFLIALCFSISMESLKRLAMPQAIDDAPLVLIVGSLGLAVNLVGLVIFQDCGRLCGRRGKEKKREEHREDREQELEQVETGLQEEKTEKDGAPLNIRGVLLHVLNDALGSVVVVVASALFYVWPLEPEQPCNWQCYVDPSLTLVMVIIILSSAAPLLKETTTILLQMSPEDLPVSAILESVCRLPGVSSVHEAHVWELAKGRNVASLHVKLQAPAGALWAQVSLQQQITQIFHRAGVHSLTLQLELADSDADSSCSAPCLSSSCQKLSCCPAGPVCVCAPPRDSSTEKHTPEACTHSSKL
ncbi:zinc transporter 10 [Danio aesculapii]|uniref:zinc transporter 10 n=1 Tax=Danio aesculapii TaxID=1142201 RepID=UPI0024BF58B0|nr:zinc transporter 10 [Danio aesculapii]